MRISGFTRESSRHLSRHTVLCTSTFSRLPHITLVDGQALAQQCFQFAFITPFICAED
eukprot:m.209397 g.209397  ORF g.209397 m.209397 type:complete len:58 (+) comp18979_c0_seq2:2483-2656(+)